MQLELFFFQAALDWNSCHPMKPAKMDRKNRPPFSMTISTSRISMQRSKNAMKPMKSSPSGPFQSKMPWALGPWGLSEGSTPNRGTIYRYQDTYSAGMPWKTISDNVTGGKELAPACKAWYVGSRLSPTFQKPIVFTIVISNSFLDIYPLTGKSWKGAARSSVLRWWLDPEPQWSLIKHNADQLQVIQNPAGMMWKEWQLEPIKHVMSCRLNQA